MKTRSLALVVLALATLASALPAAAQRGPMPDRGYNYSNRFGEPPQQRRNAAGQFDYFALVMSWSPTHCASSDRGSDELQCNRRDGKRYAFVLHGLWPQHERGYPEYCPIAGRPFVPQPVIDSVLDIMPSPRLAIHEYKKHGTCSGLSPKEYYDLSRQMFKSIKVPDRYHNPMESQFVSPDELADEFVNLNPNLKHDMVAVSCGGPGNRLREIRVCFDKTGKPRSCGRNEDQRKLCSANRMFVPPVRSSMRDDAQAKPQQERDLRAPLPGPRVIPSPRAD